MITDTRASTIVAFKSASLKNYLARLRLAVSAMRIRKAFRLKPRLYGSYCANQMPRSPHQNDFLEMESSQHRIEHQPNTLYSHNVQEVPY